MKILLTIITALLFAVNSFGQTIPVEGKINNNILELNRPLVARSSTIVANWGNSILVDTLRLSTSSSVDSSIAYVSFEQSGAIFHATQANDSTDFMIYLYAGVCEDASNRTVILIDSLDTSGDIDEDDGFWKNNSGDYVWHHNVPLSSHFFYEIKATVKTGTDTKIFNSYVLRYRSR